MLRPLRIAASSQNKSSNETKKCSRLRVKALIEVVKTARITTSTSCNVSRTVWVETKQTAAMFNRNTGSRACSGSCEKIYENSDFEVRIILQTLLHDYVQQRTIARRREARERQKLAGLLKQLIRVRILKPSPNAAAAIRCLFSSPVHARFYHTNGTSQDSVLVSGSSFIFWPLRIPKGRSFASHNYLESRRTAPWPHLTAACRRSRSKMRAR